MELVQAPFSSLPPQPPPTPTWVTISSSLPLSSLLLTPSSSSSPPSPPALNHTPDPPALPNSSWTPRGDPGAGGFQPTAAGVLIPLIYAAVCVVGLAGNALVIHVAVRHTRTASATNMYILNLAIADELFMLGLPFLAVQNAVLFWPFGALLCRVVMTVDAINQFTSIFCLTVMSVDRYLAVVHPIRSSWWRRPCVAKAVNATVWAVSFVVVLPVVVFADVLADDGNCSIVWPEPAEVWKASFIIYTFTLGFLGPLLVICLCYLLIVVKVRSSGKRACATSSRRRTSERKITRMVVVVVAVFVLCWLPFYALNVANLLVVLPGELRGLYVFVVVLSYANSCANPVLYAFLSDNFRRGFRKALCRSSRRVENREREGAEPQRPTEEWAGIAPEQEEEEEEEGMEEEEEEGTVGGSEDATQMKEMCGSARYGDSGVKESSRRPVTQGGKPEEVPPGQRAKPGEETRKGPGMGPNAAIPTTANGSKCRSHSPLPEHSPDLNSPVLEISYL